MLDAPRAGKSSTSAPIGRSATAVGAALAIGLIVVVTASSMVLAAGGQLGVGVSRAILLIALIPALVVARPGRNVAATAAATAATISFVIAAKLLIDTSYDGQEYQFDAVYSLVHGWNPYREDYGRVIAPGATVLPWPGHYPIASWLLLSVASLAGTGMEGAKFMLALPMLIVPLAWFSPLRRIGLAPLPAAALALLAMLSPIAIAQLPTRMIDGTLGSLAMAFTGFAIETLLSARRLPLTAALACLVLALDMKFNAVAMFGTLAAAWCAAAMLRNGVRPALVLASRLAGATLFAVAVIGFHPYVTNTVRHGQPFWPVLGAPELEINDALVPDGLTDRSMLGRLGRALLAPAGGDGSDYKIPFSLTAAEIEASREPDTQIGGFGPLMSGAGALAGLIALAVLGHARRGAGIQIPLLLFSVLAAISVLATPYNWWPRFVPQLWLGVVLVAMAGCVDSRNWVRRLGWSCAAILAANSLLIGAATLPFAAAQTRAVRDEIAAAKADKAGYCANFGAAHARIDVLEAAGVRVVPLAFPLPARCEGAKQIPRASAFLGSAAASCPCSTVRHDPNGTWIVPRDTTVEDVRQLHASAR